MNTAVIKRGFGDIVARMSVGKPLVLAAVVGLSVYPPARDVLLSSLAEAYFQVSVFVAATLFGMLLFERIQHQNIAETLRKHAKWQVFAAAVCGAIPGCGGAIFIITQYIRGAMSFGGVVATLTATMGDAAFLLLAKSPADALLVFAICWIAGIVSGYLVDWTHGRDFMRVRNDAKTDEQEINENPLLSPAYRLWFALFLPGAFIGVAYAAQVDVPQLLAVGGVAWVDAFGAAAALFAIIMWTVNPLSNIRLCISQQRTITRRVADTTNFITIWVLFGFVAYGLAEALFGFQLKTWFGTWIVWAPLVAVIIGFIPGCGPQIVVTTLYLNGVIPLSAQLANAVSNDGDALFPAVAIAPKASLIATLYTAVPAILVGYGWMFLVE